MQERAWLSKAIAMMIAAMFCGTLVALEPADPTQSPEIELDAPSSEAMDGLLFARSLNGGASDVRQIGKGPFKLKKGEWLFFQFTDAKANYTAHIEALSSVARRLWSAVFAQLDNESLSALSTLNELRVLQFGIKSGTSADGLGSLSKLGCLTRLAVTFNGSGELLALQHIAAVKSLKELRLSLNNTSPESLLDPLADHPVLEVLALNNWSSLSDTGMSKIGKIAKLQALEVSGCTKITDAGIAAVRGLPLSSLDIGGCDRIGDRGTQTIAAFSGLTKLYAKASGITDEGIKHLAKLVKLETLDLSDNFGVTDACMVELKKLAALHDLNLSGTELTDQAVKTLKGMQTLQTLNVESTSITAKGIIDLKKALPKAKINQARE